MTEIKFLPELQNTIVVNTAVLAYFSHEACNVCKVLKPKVEELLQQEFPLMKAVYIDTVRTPEIAGQYSVFAVPTLLCFFDGRESIRKSRNIGINELRDELLRPYEMVTGL